MSVWTGFWFAFAIVLLGIVVMAPSAGVLSSDAFLRVPVVAFLVGVLYVGAELSDIRRAISARRQDDEKARDGRG